MASARLVGSLLVALGLLWAAASGDAVAISGQKSSLLARHKRSIVTDPKQLNPELTKYEDDCPNGYVAYSKFNTRTGVFDCAIKTAEICYTLCDTMDTVNWDITNPTDIMDPTERQGWYCRALPGYATRPCYFKPRMDIERDVANMLSRAALVVKH